MRLDLHVRKGADHTCPLVYRTLKCQSGPPSKSCLEVPATEAPVKEEKKEEAPQSPELSIAKYCEKVFLTMLGERPNLMELT